MEMTRFKLLPTCLFIIASFVFLSSDTLEAKVYKWVDEQGKMHFTDDPSKVPSKSKLKVYLPSTKPTVSRKEIKKKNIPLKAPVKMVFRHSWDGPLFLGNLKESEIKKELFVKSGDLMWDAVISFGLAFFMFCGLYYVNL